MFITSTIHTHLTKYFATAFFCLCSFVVVVGSVLLSTPTSVLSYHQLSAEKIIAESNAVRALYQLPPLVLDERVAQAASEKATRMAQTGEFSHTLRNNVTSWQLLQRQGYLYVTAGENLALHHRSEKQVVLDWYRSPAHRANLLNPNFTHIGIGIARGAWFGHRGEVVVQLLAAPLAPSVDNVARASP